MIYTQEEITKAFGPYTPPESYDQDFIQQSIQEIQHFPSVLEAFYKKLRPEHFEAHYREGGWNFRQVFHHLADSHMQGFIRFKLALTEDNPTIKTYIQNEFANCEDSLICDPELSVQLLKPLHKKWVALLHAMEPEHFERTYINPTAGKEQTLGYALGIYAWHGKHHYTQMHRYASNEGWI